MDLQKYLLKQQQYIESALQEVLPQIEGPTAQLLKAMRYSVFAGGKRLRPILMLAACEAVGGESQQALKSACALEMIHTYSLIHDDLPAMDDDNFRRGVPTNHKVFGDAIAILAGDGLLTEAFCLLSQPDQAFGAQTQLQIINIAATASGWNGMVGGQVADMVAEGQDNSIATVDFIHKHKTGALILASLQIGALCGGSNPEQLKHISDFGHSAGLAFQIADDLLDIESSQEQLGKDIGRDQQRGKATYPAVAGVDESHRRAEQLHAQAITQLDSFGDAAEPLRQISAYIINRKQ
ncbi:MAG: polyprenyl synthetase family protein [Desulfuromonadaceae bacterium]|jgi:geranylgeranyl diphosphate synthase type II|nr:polyprenyl synthetase family protein [Desulfuromonas sp.]MDY0184734.1 polyprenyl synthetase family protein [Desulfuromonadaceae bacterium]